MKQLVLVLLLSLPILGCGKDGGAKATGCGTKDLFSSWSNDDVTLSLNGFQFNQSMTYGILLASGELCRMDLLLLGGQCAGSGSITNASYAGGGLGDPGCADLNGPFTFTKSAAGLSVCDDSGCETYQ